MAGQIPKKKQLKKLKPHQIESLRSRLKGPISDFLAEKVWNETIRRVGDESTRENITDTTWQVAKEMVEGLPRKPYKISESLDVQELMNRDYEFPVNLDELLSIIEKRLILKAINDAKGNGSDALVLLGTTDRSFRYRCEKYGIGIPEFWGTDKGGFQEETLGLDALLAKFEQRLIKAALENNESLRAAAKDLCISFRSLRYRMGRHDINAA